MEKMLTLIGLLISGMGKELLPVHKGKIKDDAPEITTAQNPKVLDGGPTLLEKTRNAFTNTIWCYL